MKRILTIASTAALLAAGPAFADHLNIDADNIKVEGDMVTIPDVKIDKPGFVVIHAVKDGAPVIPASIGNAHVDAGEGMTVEVKTDYALKSGEDFIAMLHYDTDGDGKYSFGEGMTDVDTPALNAEEKPYVKPFKAM